ncbi:MAG: hypothetical protein ACU0DH_01710 [Paracoccus sp. (in: a-proteobacteria)]|uniref:hypothetical protein n=1 Tax=Paracoccus sp. TaxID=267 RepID=UPI002E8267BF|nr:hypothetical protein [Pseudomonadota bacterium]
MQDVGSTRVIIAWIHWILSVGGEGWTGTRTSENAAMKTNTFRIDGNLTVQDAPAAVAELRQWIDGGGTSLDIAPVASSTGLPGQIALQILLSAEREIAARGAAPKLSPAAAAVLTMSASRGLPRPLDRSVS